MDINERLNKIENSVEAIQTALQNITRLVAEYKRFEPIVEAPKIVVTIEPPPVVETPEPVVETKAIVVIEPVVAIELVNLLNSKEWPHAVDPTLICDISSDQDKTDRAEGILDLIIDIHLENLRFLDFGCGEGHVVNRSKTQKPAMSIGYDIKKSEMWNKWETAPNVFFTDNWQEVKNLGPFNIVLMYDVIDHMLCSYEELVSKLKAIKELLAPHGKVYIRCHPWCSRHGTHLYQQINKAFAHLVFTNEELQALGYKQEKTRKILFPSKEYTHLLTSAGFKITSGPHQIKETVEPFFNTNPLLSKRIKSHFDKIIDFPTLQLEQQFIDFVLM